MRTKDVSPLKQKLVNIFCKGTTIEEGTGNLNENLSACFR